mmetsp:Transcript_106882/g.310225  ORF Transcript_106882/g.310225 Transcript_106882/m.310225 type:complete len:214 (-) Transcript_106882:361-1002(-)
MLGGYCSRAHDQALLAHNRALAHHSLDHAPVDLEEALRKKHSNHQRALIVHATIVKLVQPSGATNTDLVQCESRLNFLNAVRNVSSPPSVARHLPTLIIPSLSPHPRRVLVQYREIGIRDIMRIKSNPQQGIRTYLAAKYAHTKEIGEMISTIKHKVDSRKGWVRSWHPDHGHREYYYHSERDVSQWTLPDELVGTEWMGLPAPAAAVEDDDY